MPASYYFILALLGGEAVRFKSGQKAEGKKKRKLLKRKRKKSRPHLASKAALLIYLIVVLNLKCQISNKIAFLCVSFELQMRTKSNKCLSFCFQAASSTPGLVVQTQTAEHFAEL